MIFNELTFPFYTLHPSPSNPVTSPLYQSLILSSLNFTTFPPHTVSTSDSVTTSAPSNLATSSSPLSTSNSVPTSNPSNLATLSASAIPLHLTFSQSTSHINIHLMQTRSKSGIFKHTALTATKHPIHPHFVVDYVPTTYLQASKHSHWHTTMQKKFNALLKLVLGLLYLHPLLTILWDVSRFFGSK